MYENNQEIKLSIEHLNYIPFFRSKLKLRNSKEMGDQVQLLNIFNLGSKGLNKIIEYTRVV